MRFNPKIVSMIPLVFVLFFKWMPVLSFMRSIFFSSKAKSGNFTKMDRVEALEILGLDRKATKEEIVERYNKLIKKNHPDLGGSEWITKRINKARDILLG
jgi:preprotein translocase subunit Sec63